MPDIVLDTSQNDSQIVMRYCAREDADVEIVPCDKRCGAVHIKRKRGSSGEDAPSDTLHVCVAETRANTATSVTSVTFAVRALRRGVATPAHTFIGLVHADDGRHLGAILSSRTVYACVAMYTHTNTRALFMIPICGINSKRLIVRIRISSGILDVSVRQRGRVRVARVEGIDAPHLSASVDGVHAFDTRAFTLQSQRFIVLQEMDVYTDGGLETFLDLDGSMRARSTTGEVVWVSQSRVTVSGICIADTLARLGAVVSAFAMPSVSPAFARAGLGVLNDGAPLFFSDLPVFVEAGDTPGALRTSTAAVIDASAHAASVTAVAPFLHTVRNAVSALRASGVLYALPADLRANVDWLFEMLETILAPSYDATSSFTDAANYVHATDDAYRARLRPDIQARSNLVADARGVVRVGDTIAEGVIPEWRAYLHAETDAPPELFANFRIVNTSAFRKTIACFDMDKLTSHTAIYQNLCPSNTMCIRIL